MPPENDWGCAPSLSLWYGCVIVEMPNGETDYFDNYSTASEDVPDTSQLCPEGAEILEIQLKLTPLGFLLIGSWAKDFETDSIGDYYSA